MKLKSEHQWRRWTLRSMLIAIAIAGVVFSVVRPLMVSPAVRAARDVLEKYGPAGEPGFTLSNFQAGRTILAKSGYWQVEFVRIAGSGEPKKTVIVPSNAVDKYRFNPWR
jgi:hypothetical protein